MDRYSFDAAGVCRIGEGEGTARLRWLDVQRAEKELFDAVDTRLGITLHERHMSDMANDRHPPFYDGGAEYDLLIIRAPDRESPPESPRTHAIAFVITSDTVISVRPEGDPLFDQLRARLLDGRVRAPDSVGALFYLLLNQVAERLMGLRQPMSDKVTELQARLLDPRDPFDHWQLLMDIRSRFRWLDTNLAVQREVLDAWRLETDVVDLDEALRVRFNDIDDHLARVERHARVLESDVSTLVQVHFSANSERNNRVIQFLAVVSVIFLPLNLLAGLFGMNFHKMPLLAEPWGFWGIVASMGVSCAGLLMWFRHRRWI